MYVIYVCVHLLSTRTDFRKTRPAVYAVVEMKFEFIAHPFSLFKQTERYGVYAYCRALCLCNKKQCIEKKKKLPWSIYYYCATVIYDGVVKKNKITDPCNVFISLQIIRRFLIFLRVPE